MSVTAACNCAQSLWEASDINFSPLRSKEIGIFVPKNLHVSFVEGGFWDKLPRTSHLPCAWTEHVPTARKLPTPASPCREAQVFAQVPLHVELSAKGRWQHSNIIHASLVPHAP